MSDPKEFFVEYLINAARSLLGAGCSKEKAIKMIAEQSSVDEAVNAVAAASILLKDDEAHWDRLRKERQDHKEKYGYEVFKGRIQ